MKLSVVSTLYQTASHLEEFHRRVTAAAREFAGDDYEIVLVNDGSPDRSLEMAIDLTATDAKLTLVDLSRNFGHHKAMMTALAHAHGEHIFLIDSDLEEDPEWLLAFGEQMAREKCDVVYGVQIVRRDAHFSRWSGQMFYRVFRVLTRLPLPDNIVVCRLMTRRYVNALLLHEEREVFIAGLWLITGFDQRPHAITKHRTSETTYNLRRKISQFVNSVTSFSNVPLVGIFVSGLGIAILSGIYALVLIANWLFFATPPSGWTSVMASVWLLGGVITAFIGVVGIYISKMFSEIKHRPYTIVRQIYGGGGKGQT